MIKTYETDESETQYMPEVQDFVIKKQKLWKKHTIWGITYRETFYEYTNEVKAGEVKNIGFQKKT